MMQNRVLDYSQYIQQVRQTIKEVTCEEYAKDPSVYPVLIDVREDEECQLGVLPGAHIIPRGLLEAKLSGVAIGHGEIEPLDWLAQRNILLYCRTGGRSALAAQSLTRMGFTHIYSLAGGTQRWCELGYAIAQE
ncbi:Rhodanese-like protein [Paraglaciecola sp. T6c]|uniref:rhodanese-like domain-containing protein n=1 Tax=Pseudoalteromonas atlantica (strain T6c / ATCC BAA-1087) TaxID=3042615 RepID=UPI00005C5437|nr:rhodanese-like domain-containing protein [Paraglaciecola sp. T6c]ABG39470.1 Rhodanese-like protein [Paraglaciecola sp. T6c]